MCVLLGWDTASVLLFSFICFLHFTGIIHSDLKPANFMLVAGNLKLIDFGIANALQQDKTSVLKDSRVGTPSYMSPEAIMAACDDTGDDSADEKENFSNPRPKYKVTLSLWLFGATPQMIVKADVSVCTMTEPARGKICWDLNIQAIPWHSTCTELSSLSLSPSVAPVFSGFPPSSWALGTI